MSSKRNWDREPEPSPTRLTGFWFVGCSRVPARLNQELQPPILKQFPPDSIRVLGDKLTARDTMKNDGVPTVPGSDALLQSTEEGIRLADEIGFPVMIKIPSS